MKYTVEIKRSAEREVDRLPEPIHRRVSEKILGLEINPRPAGSRKLQEAGEYCKVAVKVIDDRGNELMVVRSLDGAQPER